MTSELDRARFSAVDALDSLGVRYAVVGESLARIGSIQGRGG
jgi:hypothetical protein